VAGDDRLDSVAQEQESDEMGVLKKTSGPVSQTATVQPLDPSSGLLANAPARVPARQNVVPAGEGFDSPAAANQASPGISNTVNLNMGMPSIQMNMMTKGPSLVTRILWYFFVGWWLSAIFIVLGVLFTWTVVLMPLGFWFINRIPKAQTMRERTRQFKTEFKDNAIVFTEGQRDQLPWFIRAPYALTIGAVAGFVWLAVAWLFGILVITLPLSIWMVDRAPAIMTLEKN
jgi:hypothetical protein